MAYLPQDVDLVRAGRRLLETEDVDRDVVARRDRPFPGRAEMDARRMAGSLERALECPGEVIVAPPLGDLPLRDADPQAVVPGRCPASKGLADRGGCDGRFD